jgi:nucleotide-binding universal stress UspA family protein
MLFEKLLVPLDGTAESAIALSMARAMVRTPGATFTLLRVVPDEEDEQARRDAQRELDAVAAELTAAGLTAQTVVRTGDPAQQIVQQARADATDLIVMRTHGRAGLARAVLGSVAEHVLALSPAPLLLLRPGGQYVSQIKSVLVPVDGSPGGALALGAAVGLAEASGASLRLLQVVVPIPNFIYRGYAFNGETYVDPAWDEEARLSAQTYVDGLAVRLRGGGLAVDTEVLIAPSVASAIADVAEVRGVDLIVMSTEALTGAARAVLGSVADAVVRTARCPVLLLRREPPPVSHAAIQTADQQPGEPDLVATAT